MGFLLLPLHLCCCKCLCRIIENQFRQNQFPDPSCSMIAQMCSCWYEEGDSTGTGTNGGGTNSLALVFGLFCFRAYVILLPWLFLESWICSCCWGATNGIWSCTSSIWQCVLFRQMASIWEPYCFLLSVTSRDLSRGGILLLFLIGRAM